MNAIYGIKNCDTMKKARTWLEGQGVAYRFHDYKTDGIDKAHLEAWCQALGWEKVLNRAGTTWRKLDEAQRAAVVDAGSAAALMQAQPSVIKRPLVQWPDGSLSVGFDAADWARRLKG